MVGLRGPERECSDLGRHVLDGSDARWVSPRGTQIWYTYVQNGESSDSK